MIHHDFQHGLDWLLTKSKKIPFRFQNLGCWAPARHIVRTLDTFFHVVCPQFSSVHLVKEVNCISPRTSMMFYSLPGRPVSCTFPTFFPTTSVFLLQKRHWLPQKGNFCHIFADFIPGMHWWHCGDRDAKAAFWSFVASLFSYLMIYPPWNWNST